MTLQATVEQESSRGSPIGRIAKLDALVVSSGGFLPEHSRLFEQFDKIK
ncbi:MAG: hypothetical protein AAGJ35_03725 [Myxococcota bacterium]